MEKMTQEDKDLLLTDICARLPYGVKGRVYAETTNGEYDINGDMNYLNSPFDVILDEINITTGEIHVVSIGNEDTVNFIEEQQKDGVPYCFYEFKPYLRPMSSITKDEEKELRLLKNQLVNCDENNEIKFYSIIDEIHRLYLSHHIDYKGLIEKGLALETSEGIYVLIK